MTKRASPILLNDDHAEVTTDLLDLLIGSILGDEGSVCHRERLKAVVADCRIVIEANDRLAREALKIMGSLVKGDIADFSELEIARRIIGHLETTDQVKNAYPFGRINESDSGYWPDPTEPQNKRTLLNELPFRQKHGILTKTTPIVSLGSCFAQEIATYLQKKGYNYVVTEKNKFNRIGGGAEGIYDSSAAWGIIFNTPSFRQVIETAFGLSQPPNILWSTHSWEGEKGAYMDPFRENVRFASFEEYEESSKIHRAAARDAFMQMKVLIVTLGLNEVWEFKDGGHVFSRSPWRIAPSFVRYRTLSVGENVAELQRMKTVLDDFNPGVKIILSLSPVPLHATFQHQTKHVVEANTHSKSVLRVAAEEFTQANEGVYYFPSYELVTSCLRQAWKEDERHVNAACVAEVMGMFEKMFLV